ncbi:MAG: SOS response-associated peptidase [Candidatus Kariarchaeaceae archaeon]|jgi:putative SOS response-associated peptidase YedK
MPSRFAFFATPEDVKERYGIDEINVKFYPYYNVKPTNRATGVVKLDKQEVVRLRWGFVKGKQFFKARDDTITEKRLFSKGFRERRCLILANGFFEWEKESGKSVPFYFKMKDDQLFAIAGVYNVHFDEEDKEDKYQFAVITTEANELVKPVFHRMPAIIPHDEIEDWFNYDQDPDVLQTMLRPYDEKLMESYQVDPLPSRGDNGPNTIRAVTSSSLDDFF